MSGLVVFDVDGTFLDSYTMFEKVVLEYSRENGLPAPAMEAIRWGYSDPNSHDFKWGVSKQEQFDHLIAIFNLMDEFSMSGDHARTPGLFAGVEESLLRLKDMGHALAIVTSKPEAPLLHLLEHHKVKGLFSAHRTWDDIARRGEKEKPEPDMLLSVMKELDFAPERTVMVGDTIMDVKMGRAAKTHTIGVAWGMHPVTHLTEAGAHHIVDGHFRHVVATVKNIFGEKKP
jgi:phosphoglycolate phosphatase